MKRNITVFIILILLLFVLFFFSVNTGSIKISFSDLVKGIFFEYDERVSAIFDLRFPRIFISLFAGAAFAVSGVLFQAVMKNPLADPGIIGISSGAGLAVSVVTVFLPQYFFLTPVFAFGGGMAACVLVYALAVKSRLNPLKIILIGVAVNAVCTGLLEVMGYMAGGQNSAAAVLGITMKTWNDFDMMVWYVLIGLFVSVIISKRCNILLLEDKTIRNLGVNLTALRIFVSSAAVLLASIATAVTGALSFVGLIVPHIARLIVGSDHKVLIPFSAAAGSFVVLLADTVGRTIMYPYEIPASVIMSVIGGPFFIFLLVRREKYNGN